MVVDQLEPITEMKDSTTLNNGIIYSKRNGVCPFSSPPLEAYSPFLPSEKIEKLQNVARRLEGLRILELNSTAQGGGVAEMLYSSIPFLNTLGIEAEWKIIDGHEKYYECTKQLHNLLQGMKGSFTREMKRIYLDHLLQCANTNIVDNFPDVVTIHDPQPMLLCRYLKRGGEKWLWRCHIDVEPAVKAQNGLLSLLNDWIADYDAAIFSAARYVFPSWPIPKYVIPPFIDPFSEKNRDLSQEEIQKVLFKYNIDPKIPIIAQFGRFDPWKGLDRTMATYRLVREERKCQLVIAGGFASDDPEGEIILSKLYEQAKGDPDIHILKLPTQSHMEINALQRASNIIMQPSTREGFGLVVTEALWKGKPVIAGNTGGITFQIKNGSTGYFYENPRKTAQKVMYLLDNRQAAERIGARGRKYVQEHFLLADRITDYLISLDMTLNSALNKKNLADCVTSFFPW